MAYEKPLPRIDEVAEPYWNAAREHKLVCQKCRDCGGRWFPPTSVCENCLSPNLEWPELSGKGTVWSFIIMHQLYYPAFTDEIPYNVAVVKSQEGPKFVTNLVGIKNEDIKVDMPVEVTFEDIEEKELTLPKWKASHT